MQRLFTMFPAGAAGWGLLLLRGCAAGMLVCNSTSDAVIAIATWQMVGLILLAGMICLGVVTPVSCIVSAIVQLFIVLCAHQPDAYQFSFSICVTAALFLLGPGAFSFDSRRFGRQLIVHTK